MIKSKLLSMGRTLKELPCPAHQPQGPRLRHKLLLFPLSQGSISFSLDYLALILLSYNSNLWKNIQEIGSPDCSEKKTGPGEGTVKGNFSEHALLYILNFILYGCIATSLKVMKTLKILKHQMDQKKRYISVFHPP